MRYQVSVAVITLAIVLGVGGIAACKREKSRPPLEAAKKSEESKKLPGVGNQPPATTNAAQSTPTQAGVTPNKPTAPGAPPVPGANPPGARPLDVRVIGPRDAAIIKARQELVARWKEIKSFSAKMTTSFDQREGNKMRFDGLGTYDYMTKDGKTFIRSKQARDVHVDASEVKLPDGGKLDEIFTGQRLLKVLDGDYVYEIDERHEKFGGVKVTKLPPDPQNIRFCGGEAVFRSLERSDTLILLPDETLDGKRTYVFESVTLGGRMKALYYFDQDTGILLKTTSEGKDPALTSTFALSEIKLNVDFSEDDFKFVPPPGVEVQDLTVKQP